MSKPGLSVLPSSIVTRAIRDRLAARRSTLTAWVIRAALIAAVAPGLTACVNPMLASARASIAAGQYPEAHQQLETALHAQGALSARERREVKDDLCATEFAIGSPTYNLLRQHQTCTDAAREPGSGSGDRLAQIDAKLRGESQVDLERALKEGDIARAVAALREYRQIAPAEDPNVARWSRQIWLAVARQDRGPGRHQKKGIHRTLTALKEDYPRLAAMNQGAFKRWIGKDTSAAGVPMLSGITITGHVLELKVPDRNLAQSTLSPQKFAQINDAFSVWCKCDGATHVASDATGLPVYLARLNPEVSRSEVLVLPWR